MQQCRVLYPFHRSNGWIRTQNRSTFCWHGSSSKGISGETGMLCSRKVSERARAYVYVGNYLVIRRMSHLVFWNSGNTIQDRLFMLSESQSHGTDSSLKKHEIGSNNILHRNTELLKFENDIFSLENGWYPDCDETAFVKVLPRNWWRPHTVQSIIFISSQTVITVGLFLCSCHSPVPEISWRRTSGVPFPSKVKMKNSNAVLEIPNFQQEDTGTYECIVENSRGKNAARGRISFHGKWSFWNDTSENPVRLINQCASVTDIHICKLRFAVRIMCLFFLACLIPWLFQMHRYSTLS